MKMDFGSFFNQEEKTMAVKRALQIALIMAVLTACLAIPSRAAADGPCGSIYIVQRGDWLIKIANRCGVSLSALYAANPGLIYQRYIYPGQALNIPGGSGYIVPQPPGTIPPPVYQTASNFYYPSLLATPHVGSNYYSSSSSVGTQLAYQVTLYNNGNTPLQITANLNSPSGWDVNAAYDDCPDSLSAGSHCTLTWLLTPQDTGYDYIRVYVRGFYTDSSGESQRVTASPAFLFVVNP
jgi:LysM domain/NPCBM-associated, NEW3 domain of alpha-galactosidase